MTTALTKTQADPIRQAVDKMAPEFRAALPAHVPVDKFIRVAMTAINSDPGLQQADRRSLFSAVTKLAQDGLLPDGREAALVIFNTKDRDSGGWVKKVQAMPMIGGLLKMMRQSGEVAWIDAHVVRAGDHFQYRPGIDEMPVFEPDWFGDRGEVIGAYAIARLKSGEIVPPEIMNRQQIEAVRAVSRSKDKGPWVDWFDQMALKTVLRRYMKRLPTSTDLESAFERDETMAHVVDQPMPTHAVEQPRLASRLDALEHEIAVPSDDQDEGGASNQEAQENAPPSDWKARVDACKTLAELGAVEVEWFAERDQHDAPEAIDGAFDAMREALKRKAAAA